VYHAFVRKKTAAMFAALSAGDWQSVTDRLAGDVRHVFPGDHPLGGERHTREAVHSWFERLGRLYPGHEFEVQSVLSRGWPWSTRVVVAWRAHLTPAAGPVNEGVHWIHLRWGKATYFHAYLDTQLIVDSCRVMAAAGVPEAEAAPITDP
jgi:ketosteroid isomerase-like protein